MASPYISTKDILHYRTLTTLLQYTEAVEGEKPANEIQRRELGKVPSRINKSLLEALSYFTVLLVRSDEVVAVLPCGERQKVVDVVVLQEPTHLNASRNPRSDEAPAAPSGAQGPGLPKVEASLLETEHPLLAVEKGFANAFSRHGHNVPFEVHCHLTAKLLKLHRIFRLRGTRGTSSLHQASDSEQSNFLAKQRKAGRITTDWDERKPVFDKAGRRLIRKLMSRLLVDVRGSLGRLGNFLKSGEEIKVAALPDSDPAFKETFSRAKALIHEAYRNLNTLNSFLEIFGIQAFRTCQWIAAIFELETTTSNVVPNDKFPPSSQEPISSSSLYVSSSVGPLSSSPVKEVKEQSSEAEDVEGYDRDIDQDAAMDLDTLAETAPSGWAKAAVKWMKDVCTQIDAMKSLSIVETRPDRSELRLSKYIEKVALKVVGVMPEARDTRMESYQDVLDSIPQPPRFKERFKEWLFAQGTLTEAAWRKSSFSGTWHCGTTLMSLHILSLGSGSETLSALESSAAVSSDIIEMFKVLSRSKTAAVSTAGVCQHLIIALKGRKLIGYETPVVFPGSHSAWTSVSLPPWLPQEMGGLLIRWAEEKLTKRLWKIFLSPKTGQSNARKRSISVATDMHEETEERHRKRARASLADTDEGVEVARTSLQDGHEMEGVEKTKPKKH
ncbi:MAG: hypothetical protein Q9212_004811 [Teloschistes hypoglaucus]